MSRSTQTFDCTVCVEENGTDSENAGAVVVEGSGCAIAAASVGERSVGSEAGCGGNAFGRAAGSGRVAGEAA